MYTYIYIHNLYRLARGLPGTVFKAPEPDRKRRDSQGFWRKLPNVLLSYGSWFHWIRWRENLNRKPWFLYFFLRFSVQFPLNQSNEYLVGGWPTPLKNMKVSWDYDIPNIWKVIKRNVPNHQPMMMDFQSFSFGNMGRVHSHVPCRQVVLHFTALYPGNTVDGNSRILPGIKNMLFLYHHFSPIVHSYVS